jgi:hypothetical protein
MPSLISYAVMAAGFPKIRPEKTSTVGHQSRLGSARAERANILAYQGVAIRNFTLKQGHASINFGTALGNSPFPHSIALLFVLIAPKRRSVQLQPHYGIWEVV